MVPIRIRGGDKALTAALARVVLRVDKTDLLSVRWLLFVRVVLYIIFHGSGLKVVWDQRPRFLDGKAPARKDVARSFPFAKARFSNVVFCCSSHS